MHMMFLRGRWIGASSLARERGMDGRLAFTQACASPHNVRSVLAGTSAITPIMSAGIFVFFR